MFIYHSKAISDLLTLNFQRRAASRPSRPRTTPARRPSSWAGDRRRRRHSTESSSATGSPTGRDTPTLPTSPPRLSSATRTSASSWSRAWPRSRSTWSRYRSGTPRAWVRPPKSSSWRMKEVKWGTEEEQNWSICFCQHPIVWMVNSGRFLFN